MARPEEDVVVRKFEARGMIYKMAPSTVADVHWGSPVKNIRVYSLVSGYNHARLSPLIQESCAQEKKGVFVVVYIEYEIRYQKLKVKQRKEKAIRSGPHLSEASSVAFSLLRDARLVVKRRRERPGLSIGSC